MQGFLFQPDVLCLGEGLHLDEGMLHQGEPEGVF